MFFSHVFITYFLIICHYNFFSRSEKYVYLITSIREKKPPPNVGLTLSVKFSNFESPLIKDVRCMESLNTNTHKQT